MRKFLGNQVMELKVDGTRSGYLPGGKGCGNLSFGLEDRSIRGKYCKG